MVADFIEVSDQEIDDIMQGVVIGNTAQGVLHKLEELERNRDHVLTRWVWELLQNARDTAVEPDTSLVASIVIDEGEVIFRHNGASFKIEEIGHLIYHGSTKIENPETIGQYGSGFLATHLLSPEIEISGRLDDGRQFQFILKREIGSTHALSESMAQAQRDFKASLSYTTTESEFTTQFRYRLKEDAVDAVEEGVQALKRCAPFVAAFNREFSKIEINSPSEKVEFKVVERKQLGSDTIQRIIVSQTENDVEQEKAVILAAKGRTSVAFPLEIGDHPRCLPVDKLPRLFLGFPLIGTEDFSFPAVVNSFDFTPTENRDGVYLGRNRNNNDANNENQEAVNTACELLVELLQFSASFGWGDIYRLANVPAITEKYWLNQDWLREGIKTRLVLKVRRNPGVLNGSGEAVPSEDVEIPVADTAEGVDALYELLDKWSERRHKMPKRTEAVGWASVVKSWARISECEVSNFDEVVDGWKLAQEVQNVSHDHQASPPAYRLSRLESSLKEGISGVEWLDQLHGFLMENGLGEAIREWRIVPSQAGLLRTLQSLYRDNGIDEELKGIADVMDGYRVWKVRRELRDARLNFISDDTGKGDWDNEYVVGELIKKLKEQSEKAPDDNFAQASVRLFTWLCDSKEWGLLRDFPVFSERNDAGLHRVIKLERADLDDEVRNLAPTKSWAEDLQPFSELFPRRNIIADSFFEAVPRQEAWLLLDKEGFCKREVIIKKRVIIRKTANLDPFLANEHLSDDEHETTESVDVTDIAFLSREDIGIMARVRQSQRLARVFWRFLTEWMTANDPAGPEPQEAACVCGESHQYYPGQWLSPLRRNRWVPLGGDRRADATAGSLADLLRASGWEPNSLNENPMAVQLLDAMGITRFDLVRAFAAETDEERRQQDNILTRIMDAAAGKTDRLNQARRFIEYLEDDEALPQVVEDRQKQRRVVKENQNLGKQVEGLVRKSLEKEGFDVRRKPIGSDFEIAHDALEDDQESGIEVTGMGRTWLVEVKATREQAVRMTEKQANTANEQGDRFLLCVVPLEDDKANLTQEEVSSRMRFVQDISQLVAPLCNNLDEFREHREKITTGDVSPVQLIVDAGTVRVQVAAPVWEGGFPLAGLLNKLATSAQGQSNGH